MDVRQLRTLLAIRKYGTFAKAAEKVSLTPAAVGQQIASLEQSLDVTLFDRTTRPPAITAQGLQVVEMANKIIRIVDETNASLKGTLIAGTLMIGSVRSSALNLLPTAMVELRENFPQLKTNLRVSLSSKLVSDVASGELDAALVAEHIILPESLRWSPFLREPLWLIAPVNFKLTDFRTMLRTMPFVRFRSGVPLSSLIDTEVSRLGINTLDVAEVDTISAILTCVKRGLGISIVPHVAFAEIDAEKLQKVPFGEPQLTRQIGIIERIDCHRSLIVKELHQALAKHSGEYGIFRTE